MSEQQLTCVEKALAMGTKKHQQKNDCMIERPNHVAGLYGEAVSADALVGKALLATKKVEFSGVRSRDWSSRGNLSRARGWVTSSPRKHLQWKAPRERPRITSSKESRTRTCRQVTAPCFFVNRSRLSDKDTLLAQRGFAESFKSEAKKTDFPLWELAVSGQELKYMDVRIDAGRTDATRKDPLYLEMFWSGELAGLDQRALVMTVTETLAKFNAKVVGPLRECGCMISMVALPFEIAEADAVTLGNAMWSDFGNVTKEAEAK